MSAPGVLLCVRGGWLKCQGRCMWGRGRWLRYRVGLAVRREKWVKYCPRSSASESDGGKGMKAIMP